MVFIYFSKEIAFPCQTNIISSFLYDILLNNQQYIELHCSQDIYILYYVEHYGIYQPQIFFKTVLIASKQ